LLSLIWLTLLLGVSTGMPPAKKLFITTVMSWLSCKMGMGTGGNWELIDGKMGMGFKFQMGMGVGWEWE